MIKTGSYGALSFVLVMVLGLAGCGADGGSTPSHNETGIAMPPAGLQIPDNTDRESYHILSLGNSHVRPIGAIIEVLIAANQTGKSALTEFAPGAPFLDERIDDGVTLKTMQLEQWTHVILQGQKYSMSAGAVYPTTAAQTWVQFSKSQGATPILFPEHPQAGNSEEGQMLYDLHQSIAANEPACVAPIGLAWDAALLRDASLVLHSTDGNHASSLGNLLTALVFYQVITGELAVALPYIDQFDADPDTQALLRQVASDTLLRYPPCGE